MCGIVGVVGNRDAALVRAMNNALYHRGPDDEGYFNSEDIDLGVRRLSIIDIEKGRQPIYNESRDKCIVFNGEIYNYRELRKILVGKGHVFETATDTEVIIHSYEEYGERCVDHLRGMFAFAIADGKKLFLARDRLGIKPLYYANIAGHCFLFASEIKALLKCPSLNVAIDYTTLGDRVVLGHGYGNETYFEGVNSLAPGHYLTVEINGPEITFAETEYYKLSFLQNESLTVSDALGQFNELLSDSVRSHLVADVDVGLTLSGGLDSTILALIMSQHYPSSILSFTISDDLENSDLRQARIISNSIRSVHSEILTNFQDTMKDIPACILAEEQPSSLFGMPLFFLCKQIGRRVKVCLNGEGADELFGGYTDYLNRHSKVNRLRESLARAKALGMSPSEEVVEYVNSLVGAKDDKEYLEYLFPFNLTSQLVQNHLHPVDRYGMASSLEIRVPYLDHYLVDFVNSMPLSYKVDVERGIKKYVLRKAAVEFYGEVTADAVLRKKIGFPASGKRFLSKVDDFCDSTLPDKYAAKHDMRHYFSYQSDGRSRISKRGLLLYDLFSFIFIDQRGCLPDGFDIYEFGRSKA